MRNVGPAYILMAMLCFAIAVHAQSQKTTRDKVYSKTQAESGGKLYTQYCAACHDPARLEPGKRRGPDLAGDKFMAKWVDKPLGDLLTSIQTQMPNDGSADLTEPQ